MITMAKPCVISFYFSVETFERIFSGCELISLRWISMAVAAVRASREEQPSSLVSPSNRLEPVTEKCKHTTVTDLELQMSQLQSATDAKFEAIIKMLQDRPLGQGQTMKAVDNDETRARQSAGKTNDNCDMSAPDIDELSIQPSMSEVRNLFSDGDSSSDLSSVSFSKRKKVKHEFYNSYIGDSNSGGNLATLFNTTDKIEDKHGIVLDNIQRDILKKILAM